MDGTLWVEDGVPWLVFCHEWIQITDGEIAAVRLKADFSDVEGDPVRLFKATDAPWVRDLKELGIGHQGSVYGGCVTDGPFLYRTAKGRLLMIWSSFGVRRYAETVAWSESGAIGGPWRHAEHPLFDDDGGHGMIFRTFEGQLKLILHQPNNMPASRARLFDLEDTGDAIRIL